MKVGDIVSLDRWDATEPAYRRLGDCRIIAINEEDNCGSGVMVTLQPKDGFKVELDSEWLCQKDGNEP